MARRTKIVATIGPASSSPEVLGRMIDAGVNVVRVNLSHGQPEQHLEVIRLVRKLAEERGRIVGVLADLPGPKVRTTDMAGGVEFVDGSVVELMTGDAPTTAERICTDYPTCASDLEPGDAIALGDGGVDLRVTEVRGQTVLTEVLNGGRLRGRPGLHLPSHRLSLPVPTDEDRRLIEEVVIAGETDFVAVSFVRSAAEIEEVRRLTARTAPRVVAKIETPAAVDDIENITIASDAVMVARGDLGTECPFEEVPVYQKLIIRTGLTYSTPVITATQMLESMITAATPTRAEASDVANAVCDGTDAVMLSAESAIGHDPARAVETMSRIATSAEKVADYDHFAVTIRPYRRVSAATAAITHGAWQAANDAHVEAILCCTRSGATAHAMAALRPKTTMITLSTDQQTVARETLTWGSIPVLIPEAVDDEEEMIVTAVDCARRSGLVHPGAVVAVLSGSKDITGSTNNLRLTTV